MIIAKITQDNLELAISEINIPYQYSQGLEIEFVKDIKYKDYTLLAFYKTEGDIEAKLMECNNDIIHIAKDVFKKIGKVSFSFSLTSGEEVIHLGVVEFYVRRAFGNNESILPQDDKNTWIDLIGNIAKDEVDNYWNSFYKEQIDSIVRDISSKVSDASNFANQANLAKTEAQQSATSASNSASNALTNANKTKEHLDNVTEKINTFNTDYVEKINSFNQDYNSKVETFNSNVEDANTALDAKIEKANTDLDKKMADANTSLDTKISEANNTIDTKVTEATTQAEKAKDEADRAVFATDGKLDKNQGEENAGKAMVVDADGNVVPGSALPDNVYTQEEVDYLLADKMDKPYVDVKIVDDTTIDCTMDGNFKISSIEGNTVQNVEENIVPTPARPVPITSKKVLANGEYVELRSLKESENLFDINYAKAINNISSNLTIDNDNSIEARADGLLTNTIGFISIPKSANYTVKWNFEIIAGDAQRGLITLINTLNDNPTAFNSGNTKWLDKGLYYARISKGQGATDDTNNVVKYSNITLIEGTAVPNNYVPPTVRDYKIVDHVNKKAWIERNIQEVNLNNLNFIYSDTKTDYSRFYAPINPNLKYAGEIYSNVFPSYKNYDYTKESIYGGNSAGGKTLSIIVKDSNISAHTQEALLEYINNSNAVAYYALETPIIEEIEYLKTDTTEIGSSFQDSTSPSATIPSEIKGVEKLEIKIVGKNLFNLEYASNHDNWTRVSGGYAVLPIRVPKNAILTTSGDSVGGSAGYYALISWDAANGTANSYGWLYHNNQGSNFYTFNRKTASIIYIHVSASKIANFLEDFKNLQIEVGDIATEYMPYVESSIAYNLEKPLLSLEVRNPHDIINTESRINNLGIYTFSGNEIFENSYANPHGYYGRYISVLGARANIAQKILCNILPFVSASWNVAQEGCCQNANQLHLKFSNERLGITDDTPLEEKKIAFSNYIKRLHDEGTPIQFMYILENPTEEPLEPGLVKMLKQLKTYNPTTNIFIGGEVKPTIYAKYPKDLALAQQKLETKLLTLQTEVVKNV